MVSFAFPTPFLPTAKSNHFPTNYKPISSSSTKLCASLISPSKINKSNFTCTPTVVSLPKFRKVLARALNEVAEKYEEEEKDEEMGVVDQPPLPKHVAIFTDGHRRWAKARGLTKDEGYKAFTKSVMEYAIVCYKMGIKVLTVLAVATAQFTTRKVS